MGKPTRVLIVEDLPSDAELCEREVTKGLGPCDFRRVETREQCLAALEEFRPELVVSDFKLPHFDGLSALRLVKERDPDMPFVILTGSMNEDTAVECIKAGASDYVIKEHVKRLGLAVRGAMEQHRARMERKRAEQALDASEARYRRLFEAAKDGILILDAETGKVVDVNPFLVELTGYSHGQFLGKHLWEIGPFKDIAASLVSFAELQAQKYVRYENLPLETSDGRTIDVEFVSNVYRVDDRDVVQCNVRDITRRTWAEKQSREQRATLDAVLESTNNPSFALDREYRYTAFNRAHAAVMKAIYGADIRVGRSLAEYQTVPKDWQTARKNLDRALHGETVVEAASSGDEGLARRYFEVAHHPVRTDSGEIIGVSVFAREVTANKRAAQELEESKHLVESIVESVPLMIFLKEAKDLRFVVFNQAGEELLGYARKDVLGKNDRELFPPEQAAFFMAKDREVLAGDVLVDIPEEPIMTAKKGERWLHTRKLCIKGADGVTKYLLGISEDITDKKRVDADREKMREQLVAAQKMEAIGSLAGGIAHDFNNLLSVILSYGTFGLEDVREGDPLRGDLIEINKAAERAARLTRQLLAFSRKQVLRPEPLDLNRAVSEMENMLRRIIGEDIQFTHVPGPDLGVVKADPSQIEQVVMNLAVNAHDAMPTGGSLTIETANVELDEGYAAQQVDVKPGPYVMLAITDTGCGMDEQTRSRAFEPFFTTKGPQKGTGLGLSTVYGIVKQSGGHIWVYSEPGRGTSFKIYLPRAIGASAPASRPPPLVANAAGTETILVVEDEPVLGVVVKRILGAAGYNVLVAQNGGEGLLICEGHEGAIHLVLTDVVMPRMSGKAFVERLAKVRPAIKVLYMSGHTDDAIVHHGVLDPGTQFIAKPFNAADLASKVRHVLDAPQTGVGERWQ